MSSTPTSPPGNFPKPDPAIGSGPLQDSFDKYQLSLDELFWKVQTDRATILDDQVRQDIKEIQRKNAILKEANAFLQKARIEHNATEDDGTRKMPQDMIDFVKAHGIDVPNEDGDDVYGKSEWEKVVQGISTFIDSLTSNSQLDMASLQAKMGKYNQTFEALSNFLNKYQSSLGTIIANLR